MACWGARDLFDATPGHGVWASTRTRDTCDRSHAGLACAWDAVPGTLNDCSPRQADAGLWEASTLQCAAPLSRPRGAPASVRAPVQARVLQFICCRPARKAAGLQQRRLSQRHPGKHGKKETLAGVTTCGAATLDTQCRHGQAAAGHGPWRPAVCVAGSSFNDDGGQC